MTVGIDICELLTQDLVDRAHTILGTKPEFCGRYFLGDDAEYIHHVENSVFNNNNLSLVPVCRETRKVSGSYQDGIEIGKNLAQDILDTFGEKYLSGKEILVFLDTEPKPEPTMTAEYYQGWSNGLLAVTSKVQFLPAVYLNVGDTDTQSNLNAAIEKGAKCHGLWVAAYYHNDPLVKEWDDDHVEMYQHVDVPVLIHQYAGDIDNGVFDCNLLNPSYPHTIKQFIIPN